MLSGWCCCRSPLSGRSLGLMMTTVHNWIGNLLSTVYKLPSIKNPRERGGERLLANALQTFRRVKTSSLSCKKIDLDIKCFVAFQIMVLSPFPGGCSSQDWDPQSWDVFVLSLLQSCCYAGPCILWTMRPNYFLRSDLKSTDTGAEDSSWVCFK